MGILASLNTGVSGMQATGESLGVTTDNIANANTTGFKTSRGEFADIVSKSLKGILGGNQIGRGVKLNSVTSVFQQGSLSPSDKSTDMAIIGDGFFVVDGQDGRAYTRDGNFQFNANGELSNGDGYKVLGFKADADGKISSALEPITLGNPNIEAKATESLDVRMNVDARVKPGAKVFNPLDPDATSDYQTNMNVFDSVGNAHSVKLYFNRATDTNWTFRVMANGEELTGGVEGVPQQQAEGTLTFTPDGKLNDFQMGQNSFNFSGATQGQAIKFNFGETLLAGGTGEDSSTMFGSETDVYSYRQDGNAAGTIAGYSFNDEGVLSASFSNGVNRDLYQVSISKFESNEGLYKLGNNRFRETKKSGEAFVGKPNVAGRGKIQPKSLESSTTDIAKEFIDLMQSQRSFQANAKVVTTANEMLNEVLSFKR